MTEYIICRAKLVGCEVRVFLSEISQHLVCFQEITADIGLLRIHTVAEPVQNNAQNLQTYCVQILQHKLCKHQSYKHHKLQQS